MILPKTFQRGFTASACILREFSLCSDFLTSNLLRDAHFKWLKLSRLSSRCNLVTEKCNFSRTFPELFTPIYLFIFK